MKKILFILGIVFFMFVIGCEKEPWVLPVDPNDSTDDEVPVVTKYTVNTSIISGNGVVEPLGVVLVDSGYSKSIKAVADPGFSIDSILVNGVKVPLDNNRYRIYPVLEDYDVGVTFDTLTIWYLFGNGSWQRDSVIEYQDDGDVIHAPAWNQDCENCPNIEYNFLPNDSVEFTRDGIYRGTFPYSLDETKNPPVLRTMGNSYEVLELNKENLVLKIYYVGSSLIHKFTHH